MQTKSVSIAANTRCDARADAVRLLLVVLTEWHDVLHLPASRRPDKRNDSAPETGTRTLIATLAVLTTRAIHAAVGAAGFGLLVATFVVSTTLEGGNPRLIATLFGPTTTVGVIFLATAIGSALLMPRRTRLIRQLERRSVMPATVKVLLIALALVALAQMPGLWRWWRADLDQLFELMGPRDPSGLWILPAALVSVVPALTALALLSFVAASSLAMSAPSELTGQVLGSTTMLQGGLASGAFLMRRHVATLGTSLGALLADEPQTPGITTRYEWFGRHDLLASSSNTYVLLILAGYVVALAITVFAGEPETQVIAPQSMGAQSRDTAEVGIGGSPSVTPTVRRVVTSWNAQPLAAAADRPFGASSYTIKPRPTVLGSLFGTRAFDYDITSIPPSSRERYLLSWNTGILRREPSGPGLLSFTPKKRPGDIVKGEYTVCDASTSAVLARLVPRAADWEIVDPSGVVLGNVLELRAGYGQAKFVINAGEHEVCVLSWRIGGLTVHSAALDVEFKADAARYVEPGVALVLAAMVEQRARFKSRLRA
jgi:hypothetical protein